MKKLLLLLNSTLLVASFALQAQEEEAMTMQPSAQARTTSQARLLNRRAQSNPNAVDTLQAREEAMTVQPSAQPRSLRRSRQLDSSAVDFRPSLTASKSKGKIIDIRNSQSALVKATDALREARVALYDKLSDIASSGEEKFQNAIKEAKSLYDTAQRQYTDISKSIKASTKQALKSAQAEFDKASKAFDQAQSDLLKTSKTIEGMAEEKYQAALDLANKKYQEASDLVASARDHLVNLLDEAKNRVKGLYDVKKSLAQRAREKIGEFKQAFGRQPSDAQAAVLKEAADLAKAASLHAANAKKHLSEIVEQGRTFFKNLVDKTHSQIQLTEKQAAMLNSVKSAASDIKKAATDRIRALRDDLQQLSADQENSLEQVNNEANALKKMQQ